MQFYSRQRLVRLSFTNRSASLAAGHPQRLTKPIHQTDALRSLHDAASFLRPMNDNTRKTTRLLSAVVLVLLAVSLAASLFFKEKWLWMDEVLSYVLISDPSIAHLNNAAVSGMDANPPLFANVYWFIGHAISLNTQFLRTVSVFVYALTIALFFIHVSSLLGRPVTNFVLITLVSGFTYLNLTLSTQIRAYALFLLVGLGYFVVIQRLIREPGRARLLAAHVAVGLLLALTHNFGLFYLAASGAFFGLLVVWSRDRAYLWVLGTYGVILLLWLLLWYPSFSIQTQAGKPHSWIPLPTFQSFFHTVGELAPNLSSTLERQPGFGFLPILRFIILVGLFLWIALSRLTSGFQVVRTDKAFAFYLLSGFVYLGTIAIALTVTFVHTSVFISRYLWPSHLLVIYQLVYAYYHVFGNRPMPRLTRLLPVYGLLLAGFLFYQNKKTAHFPSGVLSYLPQLDKRYPVLIESADYFLPIWFYNKDHQPRYLLDWQTASVKNNILSATVEYNILKSLREKYHVSNVITTQGFNKTNVPHFYVIDEASHYQIEHFLQNGQVHIVGEIPIHIAGHRLLECTF